MADKKLDGLLYVHLTRAVERYSASIDRACYQCERHCLDNSRGEYSIMQLQVQMSNHLSLPKLHSCSARHTYSTQVSSTITKATPRTILLCQAT